MEAVLAVFLQLLSFWFALAFLLIVLPSVFGLSLGISEFYLQVLVKILEWATLRIQKGIRREQKQIPYTSSVIIQRERTTMEKEIAGNGCRDFELSDVFYFTKKGFEAIVEDEVTQRFTSEELVSWNLLTRTNVNFHYISLRLTIVWVIGVFMRYCFLLPLRTKDWLSDLVHLTCCRILVRALSGSIRYHNRENRPQKGGICVANHTSPIDVIILTNDGCYAMVGQAHGGLMGVIQRATVKASPHVWFERSEMKDRHLVTKRLREHISNKDKLPILIFPEGTCINNTSYDPRFGDAFWNSSKYNIVSYLLRIMTSWAIVCQVWYLPPVTRKEGEDAVEFANRVKSAIARQGGLTELSWDGGLKRAKVKETFKEEEQKNYSKFIIGNGTPSNGTQNSG
ncbi:putative Glycerol-3-phosphate acyltransferase 3-like protein [Naja naja]|nr:putative Glycerol-3-phosphate acyltransferase 3-like protein [Naja naja]